MNDAAPAADDPPILLQHIRPSAKNNYLKPVYGALGVGADSTDTLSSKLFDPQLLFVLRSGDCLVGTNFWSSAGGCLSTQYAESLQDGHRTASCALALLPHRHSGTVVPTACDPRRSTTVDIVTVGTPLR